tara:strand:+ start:324 stop:1262 length:939 start_codon:yes stop_codon:yes gene_type:complete
MKPFPLLKRSELTTLQVNIGYKCNQVCSHCHVNAGPNRKEMMEEEIINLIPKVLKKYNLKTLDITGGAPELHPHFKGLVKEAREIGVDVIDRCNLTILSEPGFSGLARFLADNKVIIVASLPCYEKDNVDKQRGFGVFERSLLGLRQLNELGYGKSENGLILNLVFNPQGAKLPPPQELLEKDYKCKLMKDHGIVFNNLYTITNMPIKRFATQLKINGEFDEYQKLLFESHNPCNLNTVMCRSILSVNWEGDLFDCDFNQQLGQNISGESTNLKDLIEIESRFIGNSIQVGNHCYGCTAGSGSSCSGSLEKI